MKVVITGCGRHSKSLVQSLKNNVDGREVEVIGINRSEEHTSELQSPS